MKFRWILGSLLGVAAVLVLVFLYSKTKSVDIQGFNANLSDLRELQRMDASWNVESLKSQMAMTTDFDSISQYWPEIQKIKTRLAASEIADPNQVTQAIVKQYYEYVGLLDSKRGEIERFKSGHAILRNSIRYLPLAGDAFLKAAAENGQRDLVTETERRLKDVYLYIQQPEESIKERLGDWLQTNFMNYPEAVANAGTNMVSHTRVILERKKPTDDALDSLIALPTAEANTTLVDLYSLNHERQLGNQDYYRLLLVLYATFLLLVVLVTIAKLIQAWGVAKSNETLKQANQELEAKVAERTEEISTAYQKLKDSQVQLVQSSKLAAGRSIGGGCGS